MTRPGGATSDQVSHGTLFITSQVHSLCPSIVTEPSCPAQVSEAAIFPYTRSTASFSPCPSWLATVPDNTFNPPPAFLFFKFILLIRPFQLSQHFFPLPTSSREGTYRLPAFPLLLVRFSLYLWFLEFLIMICLGVVLFGSNSTGTLCASWTCMSISFAKLGNFSFISFSNRFLISSSFFSPSGTHMMWRLNLLKLS